MENASKALVMAGGILIALLVIGALMLMFNQVGDYEKAQSSSDKNSQLVAFNNEFEKYIDNKGITGADIISLINKVINYNNKAEKGGVSNSVNYDIKMQITVSGLTEFNKKYAYNESKYALFSQDSYTFKNSNKLKEVLDSFTVAESNISIENLKILSSIYDSSKKENDNKKSIKEKLIEIDSNKYSDWDGADPSLDTIRKYRQYSEFKTSTFVISQDPVYQDGQIKELYFKFSK